MLEAIDNLFAEASQAVGSNSYLDANSSEDLIHQEEDDQAAAPVSVKEIPSAATVPMSEVLSPTAGKEVQTVEKEVQTVENLLRKENEMPEPKRPSPSILKNRIQFNDMPSKDASTPRFNLYNNQRRFVNSQGRLSPPNKQPMSFPVADEEDYRLVSVVSPSLKSKIF